VAIVGLPLAATRGRAAAACPSACMQQLRECKRTCASGGQARRDCRAACAERSTCTAPGARIRTFAYVVTECRQDPQGLFSSGQKLLVRRGNCDPVTVKEFDGGPPRLDPLGLCRVYGGSRFGDAERVFGPFQRLAVLPDGSGVVFEVTNQFSVSPGPQLPEEGIFFVRANGKGLRRLGPASRFRPFRAFRDGTIRLFGDSFPVSPDGRRIALIDLGPFDGAGHEAPQIFLLDLRSGRRRQLTHQSHVDTGEQNAPICCIQFLNQSNRHLPHGLRHGGRGDL
jgi:hypothetical protein